MKIRANAKINLFLDILGKCDNGYHYVDMIMQSVDLHDVLEIEPTTSKKIEVASDYNFDGAIEENTVYKAASLFFARKEISNPGIRISIHKQIPVCAGLAGGSADAAAMLVALDYIFDTRLSKQDLVELASKVGADVPFCVLGGTMFATGIGTELKPLNDIPECYIVIVKPEFGISTKFAYEQSDKLGRTIRSDMSRMIDAIQRSNLKGICDNLYNRFEEVLSLQEIRNIEDQLKLNGAVGTSMSGSGPTVFGIFQDKKLASDCVAIMKKNYPQTFVCSPTKQGCSIF